MKLFKTLFSVGAISVLTISSLNVLMPSTAKAQTGSCDWFTGSYKDAGRGVIVHLGGNRLVVYNGNPTPLNGRCIDNERIEVIFRSNLTLIGRKTRNAPDVAWSNGTVWRRESNTVNFPISGF
jgi:hypothetical protein